MGKESEKSFTFVLVVPTLVILITKTTAKKTKLVSAKEPNLEVHVVPKPKVHSLVTKFPCTVYHPLPISTQSSFK